MNCIYKKEFRIMVLTVSLFFCNLAGAEHFTVDSADQHDYKKLINRTDSIKIFYTVDGGDFSCNVEVALDQMKWTSRVKQISEELLYSDPLLNCLSSERAKQILSQTFLEFGQGL